MILATAVAVPLSMAVPMAIPAMVVTTAASPTPAITSTAPTASGSTPTASSTVAATTSAAVAATPVSATAAVRSAAIPVTTVPATTIIPATRWSSRAAAATSTGRILGEGPQLERDHQVLTRRDHLRLQWLIPWNGAQAGARSRPAERVGSRGGRVHDRIGEGVAESKADRGARYGQAVGVGQLDDQWRRQRLADRRALLIAADDGKAGGDPPSGARQGQTLATAGEGEHGEGQGDRALPHSASE